MKEQILTSRNRAAELWHSPQFCMSMAFLGGLSLVAVIGPLLSAYNPNLVELSLSGAQPSAEHLLGCDLLGRDLLASLIFGAKTTLYIAGVTVIITASLGTLIGLFAGYFGGLIDTVLMRFVDIVLAFPGFLLNLALASLLGPSINNIILAISATGWASFARLVRGQVLTLKQREYITASKMLGASDFRIIYYHLLPAIYSLLVVTTSFALSSVILVEASISFLGLGAPDSAPTWGSLLNQGRKVLFETPLLSVMPGFLIMLTVLAFNFIGDRLRDLFDPREL